MDFRIGILPSEIKKTEAMNESIKFVNDDKRGRYAKNDTGVMVGVVHTAYSGMTGIVRLSDDSYCEAPLADIEYAGS